MISKKLFLWPIIISVVGHVLLITAGSMVDLRENVRAAELFSVQIAEPEPEPEPAALPRPQTKPAPEKKTGPVRDARSLPPEGLREDTVDIGSVDAKYAAYLAQVKKKIQRIWKYPAQAYSNNEVGVVMILMSIDADGSLSQVMLTSSSGSPSLDQGTLDVINAAAPFQPLPAQYNLSRLHITASFRYQ
ncbi:MAG: energy transducer TonB [Smithellaceae bacterium]|nr:energy transducer TonB [Syntrophaceae bacterium]MDD4241460.1 energy transducer TonB [Smithellaceae bacterium]NLX52723.1 energy transducer TonB [Deltaproteobacteria bacterium]